MKLKPKEILWEITNKCNKNCLYCGSKDTINNPNIKELSWDDKRAMALNILKLGPDEVTFSGGEPGCVYGEVIQLAKMLFPKIKCKVITNGNHIHQFLNTPEIAAVGLSINSIEDISALKNLMEEPKLENLIKSELGFGGKITIVTNFGNHNIFQFKQLFDFVEEYNCYWQLQLTEGVNLTLTKEGILHLYDLINKYCVPCDTMGFCLADDLQITHECSAGIHGLGITCDGYVTSCLSKRSWSKIETTSKNLVDLTTHGGLFNIWASDYFNVERFCDDCPCCRSQIKYPNVPVDYVPVMKMRSSKPIITTTCIEDEEKGTMWFPKREDSGTPQIIMYGVFPSHPTPQWGEIKVYSVSIINDNSISATKFPPYDPNISFRYGLIRPQDCN